MLKHLPRSSRTPKEIVKTNSINAQTKNNLFNSYDPLKEGAIEEKMLIKAVFV